MHANPDRGLQTLYFTALWLRVTRLGTAALTPIATQVVTLRRLTGEARLHGAPSLESTWFPGVYEQCMESTWLPGVYQQFYGEHVVPWKSAYEDNGTLS